MDKTRPRRKNNLPGLTVMYTQGLLKERLKEVQSAEILEQDHQSLRLWEVWWCQAVWISHLSKFIYHIEYKKNKKSTSNRLIITKKCLKLYGRALKWTNPEWKKLCLQYCKVSRCLVPSMHDKVHVWKGTVETGLVEAGPLKDE